MGGRGGSGGRIGERGTGIELSIRGKKRQYWVDNAGKYRELQSANLLPIGNESIKKMVENGSARIIGKAEMSKIREKIRLARESKPDYEMGLRVPYGNANNRRAARMSRLASRVQKISKK